MMQAAAHDTDGAVGNLVGADAAPCGDDIFEIAGDHGAERDLISCAVFNEVELRFAALGIMDIHRIGAAGYTVRECAAGKDILAGDGV